MALVFGLALREDIRSIESLRELHGIGFDKLEEVCSRCIRRNRRPIHKVA
jgi:hypothetical protein